MTKEDIHAILFEAKKMESAVYVDTRSPYPKEIARKPYPTNYTPPIFPKYDGITENAREHIRQYVDALCYDLVEKERLVDVCIASML